MSKNPKTLPFSSASEAALHESIRSLVAEMHVRHKRPVDRKLPREIKERLTRDFKDAAHGRSAAFRAMKELGMIVQLEDDVNYAVKFGPTKTLGRAIQKLLESRTMHDLERGRMRFRTATEYIRIRKLLDKVGPDGIISGIEGVRIIPNKKGELFSDHLETEKKSSGYAGSLNFDLMVPLSTEREGAFEVQIMPYSYEYAYDHSHHFLEMMRILDEVPEGFRGTQHTKLREAIRTANSSLFSEEAIRGGFDILRKDGLQGISEKTRKSVTDILDQIRIEIERTTPDADHRPKWATGAATATTYAKTSLSYVKDHSHKLRKPEKNSDLPDLERIPT